MANAAQKPTPSDSPPRPVARRPSVLDRPVAANYRVEHLLHVVIFAVAILLNCFNLGVRPYHHDESIHAFYSWKIAEEGIARNGVAVYKYDPVYHGLVLYYASAAVMALLGDNDFTGRLSAVLFGLGVLAFAWPLRRYLGRWGALSFAALATFSPAWLYFCRFVRHDIYLAFGNMGAVYFAFRYGDTRKWWYLPISAAFLGLACATKEDNYFIVPIFLIAFVLMLVWEVLGDRTPALARKRVWSETRDLLRGWWMPLGLSAVVFLLFWTLIYSSFLTNPKYWSWSEPWRVFEPINDAIHYWIGQHRSERIGGPWWYYFPQFALYDPLILFGFFALLGGPLLSLRIRDRFDLVCRYLAYLGVPACFILAWNADWGTYQIFKSVNIKVGTLAILATFAAIMASYSRIVVPDRFTRFCVLWSIGVLVIYSWAQEKVPWLLVSQLQPLLLVAGRFYGDLIERDRLKGRVRIGLAVVGALTLWILFNVNYRWDAPKRDPGGLANDAPVRHGEMLAYVQSTYDIHEILDRIEAIRKILGVKVEEMRLHITGDATWPFSWYLRHYPVNWGAVSQVDTSVVIVDRKETVNRPMDNALKDKYQKVPFQIRGWWTWENAGFPSPAQLVKWILTREAWSVTGSSDAVAYLRNENHLTRGVTTYEKIAVNPPPPAVGWPRAPDDIRPVAGWGQKGSAHGQFFEPRGMSVDAIGNLYVADSKNHRVQKLAPNGEVLLVIGGTKGEGPGEFNDPHDVTVDSTGNIYVADTWNHRVQKFDSSGKFLKKWGEGLWGPRGIAVSNEGRVFLTDTGNKRVLIYDFEGNLVKQFGHEGTRAGEFIEPVGIEIDSTGRLLVADTGNHRIQLFDLEGNFLEEWRVFGWEEFYSEPYLAPQDGQVLATDSYEHRFARYRGSMNLNGVWGGAGNFNRPIGIAAHGNLIFVADTMNHRIQKFELPP